MYIYNIIIIYIYIYIFMFGTNLGRKMKCQASCLLLCYFQFTCGLPSVFGLENHPSIKALFWILREILLNKQAWSVNF